MRAEVVAAAGARRGSRRPDRAVRCRAPGARTAVVLADVVGIARPAAVDQRKLAPAGGVGSATRGAKSRRRRRSTAAPRRRWPGRGHRQRSAETARTAHRLTSAVIGDRTLRSTAVHGRPGTIAAWPKPPLSSGDSAREPATAPAIALRGLRRDFGERPRSRDVTLELPGGRDARRARPQRRRQDDAAADPGHPAAPQRRRGPGARLRAARARPGGCAAGSATWATSRCSTAT